MRVIIALIFIIGPLFLAYGLRVLVIRWWKKIHSKDI